MNIAEAPATTEWSELSAGVAGGLETAEPEEDNDADNGRGIDISDDLNRMPPCATDNVNDAFAAQDEASTAALDPTPAGSTIGEKDTASLEGSSTGESTRVRALAKRAGSASLADIADGHTTAWHRQHRQLPCDTRRDWNLRYPWVWRPCAACVTG